LAFFFGAAFFAFFIGFLPPLDLSEVSAGGFGRRQLTKRTGGETSTPPFPRGAYFFFFAAFLAAFFFAGILEIPPFGPGNGHEIAPRQHLGYEGA
jgi:hypothetical protein